LSDLPHPIIKFKNPEFPAFHLAGHNEFHFNKYNKIISLSFLVVSCCPLSFLVVSCCPKFFGIACKEYIARLWVAAASAAPGWYAYAYHSITAHQYNFTFFYKNASSQNKPDRQLKELKTIHYEDKKTTYSCVTI